MVYLDLILNLALLVALTVVSGFIDKRWPRHTRMGVLLQGFLFGGAAVIGMLRPLNLGPGLIFDGRSVMVSLCALFFGPWAAAVSFGMTAACRITLGGMGTFTGILVILSSVSIGLVVYFRGKNKTQPPSARNLYLFGLVVHLAMLAAMFTLPENAGWSVVKRIGLPILLLYPLATILAGKILSDQASHNRNVEMLRESEERYRLLFNTSLDAIIFIFPDGRISAANPAACHILGRSEEEIIAVGRNGILDTTDPRLAAALEERARTGKFAGELTFIRKDGSKFQGEISTTVFKDTKGLLRAGMVIRDITGRKNSEAALKEAELKFRTIFDFASDGILLARVDDRTFLIANRKICEMLAYSVEELLQLSLSDIHPEESLPDVIHQFEMLRRQEIFTVRDVPMMKKDKTVFFAEVSSSPIIIEGRECLLGLFRDVSERKQAEEQIKQLNKDLEQRVSERTAELKNAVANLEELNRVFVGRELKMLELKKRIAELEGK